MNSRWLALICWLLALAGAAPVRGADQATVVVVVGAAGESVYGDKFNQWADWWRQSAASAPARLIRVGEGKDEGTDRVRLQQALEKEDREGPAELWLVLLGHGTFDGKQAKFNLRGPDLSAEDLAAWLQPFRRPVAIINTASSSAPFLAKLSAPGRVVVTATRSGAEQNFTRFGEYFSRAIGGVEADLDKDGQTSLLEAYLTAARQVQGFYEAEGRLATEHALLDDNGDGLGTPADWFRGVRAVKKAKEGAQLDGFRAHQFHLVRNERERRLPPAVRARRDELEQAVNQLREKREGMPAPEYYRQLEVILLELARLYEQAEAPAARP